MMKTRAVMYCRYSSENQRDGYSIEAQTSAIEAFCKSNDISIVGKYIDEARSGTSDNREQFLKMISDSSKNLFDVVIVHKLDRFARNKYDSVVYKKTLKDNKVKLISVLEKFDDSPESVIMEGLLESLAEYYSLNLAREVKKGKDAAAKKCKFVGGKVAYGYRTNDDKDFIVYEPEAMIVREIFRRVASKETYAAIVRDLNARGLRTAKGYAWAPANVSRIVTNPIYKGCYTYRRDSASKESPAVVVEGGVPSIVETAVYDACTPGVTNSRKAKSHTNENEYALTGYIFCECGAPMSGIACGGKLITLDDGSKIRKNNHYYRCPKRRRDNKEVYLNGVNAPMLCTNSKYLPRGLIEDYTVRLIKHVLNADDTIERITIALQSKLDERLKASRSTDDIELEIKKLRDKESRLLDLYLSGSIAKDVYELKAKEFQALKKSLADELAVQTPTTIKLDVDIVRKLLDKLSSGADANTYNRMILSTFLDKIVVGNADISFILRFPIEGDKNIHIIDKDSLASNITLTRACVTLHATVPITALMTNDLAHVGISIRT